MRDDINQEMIDIRDHHKYRREEEKTKVEEQKVKIEEKEYIVGELK
jgi:hypothetical protein